MGRRTNAFGDPQLLINISVWESIDALWEYVYRSQWHSEVFRDGRRWFEPLKEPGLALRWIPAGQTPTIDEAVARLELLRRNGPSPPAFTFKTPFSASETPSAHLVRG